MNITEPSFDQRELDLLKECLDSKWVTQGPMVTRFENQIAAKHALRHALATTSCTAALHLAAMALDLGPGDEVIIPAFTWVTSAHCAEYVGATPVFCDIDLAPVNIDPTKLEAAITPKTKAIVVVHLFGLAAPMEEILTIARRHNLAIIEDAACAVGTTLNGEPIGAMGDVGCFSFHPRKVVTTGEGGALTTNRDDLADRVRSLRNHGATGLPSPDIEPHGPWTMATFNSLGFNLRLSDIQAAVGVAQMEKLDTLLAERRALAAGYTRKLADVQQIARPNAGDVAGHSFQSYVIRVCEGGRSLRNKIMADLLEQGIQTRPGTHAVHRLGYYASKYDLQADAFPCAAQAEDTTIALPIFPGMQEEQQDKVVSILKSSL